MRVFRDSHDTDWTVFEVRRRFGSKGELSYLPGGYSDGWLCFESMNAKRRLVRFPDRWREFTDAELESLLGEALPAPRSAFRPADDLGDGTTSPDIRAE
jgi:hypothetical protein